MMKCVYELYLIMQQNYKPWKEQKYFINEIFFCKYVIKEKKSIFKLTQSMNQKARKGGKLNEVK